MKLNEVVHENMGPLEDILIYCLVYLGKITDMCAMKN